MDDRPNVPADTSRPAWQSSGRSTLTAAPTWLRAATSNRTWQRSYWGGHYRRLKAIKEKYHPQGLFYVHHGVGTEGWSADGFGQTG